MVLEAPPCLMLHTSCSSLQHRCTPTIRASRGFGATLMDARASAIARPRRSPCGICTCRKPPVKHALVRDIVRSNAESTAESDHNHVQPLVWRFVPEGGAHHKIATGRCHAGLRLALLLLAGGARARNPGVGRCGASALRPAVALGPFWLVIAVQTSPLQLLHCCIALHFCRRTFSDMGSAKC